MLLGIETLDEEGLTEFELELSSKVEELLDRLSGGVGSGSMSGVQERNNTTIRGTK